MYCFFLLIFFFFPLPVFGETIYTPYYETQTKQGDPSLEKDETKQVYLLEKDSFITDDYYSIDDGPKGMIPLLDQFIYKTSSTLQRNCEEKEHQEIKWTTKTWYQKLMPIHTIYFKSNTSVLLKNLQIIHQKKKVIEQKDAIYLQKGKERVFDLSSDISLDELSLSFQVFLNVEDQDVEINIRDNQNITQYGIKPTQKGFTSFSFPMSKEIKNYKMTSTKMTNKPLHSTYTRIIKEEKWCQIKEKAYRFQQKKETKLSDTQTLEGYHLLKIENQTKSYRREKIVLRDTLVTRTPYLLVDDIVLETSFPLKDLKFSYEPFTEEGIYPITLSYRDFQFTRWIHYQKSVE